MTLRAASEASAPISEQLRPWAWLPLLARRVHFLAGLAVAPFLAVLAVTGLAYAFTPQINDVLYGDALYTDTRSDRPVSLDDQVDMARSRYPGADVGSVVVPAEPGRTTQVALTEIDGLEQTGSQFSSESLTLYVDPYTGEVNGELVTVNGRPPAQAWLRTLHSTLHLGAVGNVYSEFAASWLPIILLGGIVLWARRGRRSARALLLPSGQPGRPRLRSWHGVLGLWLAVGLLGVSITGLTWSTFAGDRVDVVVTVLDGKSPDLAPPDDMESVASDPVGFDRVITVARDEGLRGELTVTPPTVEGTPYEVEESSDGLPIRKTAIAVDPSTADVVARTGWGDYPVLAKLTSLGIDAHSGALFGLANQLLLAALAIGTLVLLGLGYRMWWRRRPAPVPAAALRRMPRRAAYATVGAALMLGWAIPVLGVTLAAFVVVDLIRNAMTANP